MATQHYHHHLSCIFSLLFFCSISFGMIGASETTTTLHVARRLLDTTRTPKVQLLEPSSPKLRVMFFPNFRFPGSFPKFRIPWLNIPHYPNHDNSVPLPKIKIPPSSKHDLSPLPKPKTPSTFPMPDVPQAAPTLPTPELPPPQSQLPPPQSQLPPPQSQLPPPQYELPNLPVYPPQTQLPQLPVYQPPSELPHLPVFPPLSSIPSTDLPDTTMPTIPKDFPLLPPSLKN